MDVDIAVVECASSNAQLFDSVKRGDVVVYGSAPDHQVNIDGALRVSRSNIHLDRPLHGPADQGMIVNAPDNTGTLYTATSSDSGPYGRTISENDVTPQDARNILQAIEVHKYKNGQIDCSAEQVSSIYPKATYRDPSTNRHYIDYTKLIPVIIKSLQ